MGSPAPLSSLSALLNCSFKQNQRKLKGKTKALRIARRKAGAGCSRCPAEGRQSSSPSHPASSNFRAPGGRSPRQPLRAPHTWFRRARRPRVSANRGEHLPAGSPTSARTHAQTGTRPRSAPLTYLQSRFLLEMPSDRPPPVRGELQPYRPGIAGTRPAPRQRSGAWSGSVPRSARLRRAEAAAVRLLSPPASGNTPGIRLKDARGRVK